jgi:hypothetical protein
MLYYIWFEAFTAIVYNYVFSGLLGMLTCIWCLMIETMSPSPSSDNIIIYKWPPLFVGASVLINNSHKYFRILRFISKQFQYQMNTRTLEPQISNVYFSANFLVIYSEILKIRYSWTVISDKRHTQNICVPWIIYQFTSTLYRIGRNKFTENFAYCLFIKYALI